MTEHAPALTPEEWEEALAWEGGVSDYMIRPAEELGFGKDSPDDVRALAALALHVAGPNGEPLFTHEDVRRELETARGYESGDFLGYGAHAGLLANHHRSIAARLASLLPPEPKP